jgi:hypothetical protein
VASFTALLRTELSLRLNVYADDDRLIRPMLATPSSGRDGGDIANAIGRWRDYNNRYDVNHNSI